ncbi:MAG: permease [Eubacteriales bacterium]|nr:permease [Eubacteriales bacterium]
MFTAILYGLAFGLLLLSFFKDRKKTKMALKKSWKSFENILPQMLAILPLIGLVLAILSPETISGLIGKQSGWLGIAIAATLGSITLIPGFVAFPLAAALLEAGAGISQIAVFVSTLMMVGIVTLPVEMKYFGKRATLTRNALALFFSVAIALILGGLIA